MIRARGGGGRRRAARALAGLAVALAAGCAGQPGPEAQLSEVIPRDGGLDVREVAAVREVAGEPPPTAAQDCPGVDELRTELDALRAEIRGTGSSRGSAGSSGSLESDAEKEKKKDAEKEKEEKKKPAQKQESGAEAKRKSGDEEASGGKKRSEERSSEPVATHDEERRSELRHARELRDELAKALDTARKLEDELAKKARSSGSSASRSGEGSSGSSESGGESGRKESKSSASRRSASKRGESDRRDSGGEGSAGSAGDAAAEARGPLKPRVESASRTPTEVEGDVLAATRDEVAVRDDAGDLMLVHVRDTTKIHREDVRLEAQDLSRGVHVKVKLAPEKHEERRDTADEIEVVEGKGGA